MGNTKGVLTTVYRGECACYALQNAGIAHNAEKLCNGSKTSSAIQFIQGTSTGKSLIVSKGLIA
jgi:hypothetical protein